MSLRNVELNRDVIAAFNKRDLEAIVARADPTIELHSAFAAVGGAVYHGHAGLHAWLRDLEDAWGGQIRIEPQAYFDLGEQTLLFHVLSGRGKHSGVDVTMPNAQVARWRGGLAMYLKIYAHREDALAELGVSEEELEPIEP